MRIQKNNFKNNEILQIYINEKEQKDENIRKQINELKSKYNVSIFIAGEGNTIETIKEMLNYKKCQELK